MFRRYRDLLFAFGVLLPSIAIAAYAFAAARNLDRPTDYFLTTLREGERHYILKAGDICTGSMTTRFAIAGMYGLKSSGTFRALYGRMPINTDFSMELFFNPLRQLSQGMLAITGPNFTLNISASNTNPVKLAVTTTGAFNYAGTVEVPGPILITKVDDGYQIRYDSVPLSTSPVLASLIQGMNSSLKLSFIDGSEESLSCPVGSRDRLDLTRFMNNIGALAGPFSTLIQPKSGGTKDDSN